MKRNEVLIFTTEIDFETIILVEDTRDKRKHYMTSFMRDASPHESGDRDRAGRRA